MGTIKKEDALKIKEFVNSLPEEKRKEFQTRYDSADSEGKAKAAERILTSLSEKQKADMNDTIGSAVGIGATGAALGAGAYGLKKVADVALDPFYQRQKLVKTEIEPIKQKYQINKNIPANKIPTELKVIEEKATLSARNGVIKETANNLAKNYPAWREQAFQSYVGDLNKIDSTIRSTGSQVPMESAAFTNDVLQKTADDLRLRGLEREATLLEKNVSKIEPNTAMGFSQAKQLVTDLTKNNPKIGRSLVENFGEFLANDPVVSKTEAGTMFKTLQDNYSSFKQTDIAASRIINRKTGLLDTQKITSQIDSFVKGKGNPQLGELLTKMGSDHPLTKGIPGVSDQVLKLNDVAKNISDIKNTKIQVEGVVRQIDGLNDKIKTRGKVAKGVGMAIGGGLLGKGLGLMNIASMPLQGISAAQDFAKWKEEASRQPNSVSRLNPITGMPEKVDLSKMVL